MFVRFSRLAVLVAAVGLFAAQSFALEFNFDFEVPADLNVNDFHLRLTGNTEPTEWYEGPLNPFPNHNSSMMFGKTDLTWDGVVVGAGTIHLGFTAPEKVSIEKDGADVFPAWFTWNTDHVGNAVPVGGCWYTYDENSNVVSVYVNNDAGPDTITIYGLSYYLPPSKMPLDSLMWDQITWTSIPGTYDLVPMAVAGPFTIGGVASTDNVVFGWKTVWKGDTSEVRAIFQEEAGRQERVPTTTHWGLIVLVLLLLVSGLLITRRRLRVLVR